MPKPILTAEETQNVKKHFNGTPTDLFTEDHLYPLSQLLTIQKDWLDASKLEQIKDEKGILTRVRFQYGKPLSLNLVKQSMVVLILN